MSYCPENGVKMELVAEDTTVAVYICDCPVVWVYSAVDGSYVVQESSRIGNCPTCSRKATPLVYCEDCEDKICAACWAEHEFDARCEV